MDYESRLAVSDARIWLDDVYRIIRRYPIWLLAIIALNLNMLLGGISYHKVMPLFNGGADIKISFNIILYAVIVYIVHHDILFGHLRMSFINLKRIILFSLLFFFVYHIFGLINSLTAWLLSSWFVELNLSVDQVNDFTPYLQLLLAVWAYIMFPLVGTLLPEYVVDGRFKLKDVIRRGARYFWKIFIGLILISFLLFLIVALAILILKLFSNTNLFSLVTVQTAAGKYTLSNHYFVQVFLNILACLALILEARLFSRIFLMDKARLQIITKLYRDKSQR